MPSANDDTDTTHGVAKEEGDDASTTSDSQNKVEKTLDFRIIIDKNATPGNLQGSGSQPDAEDWHNASQSSERFQDYSSDYSERHRRRRMDSESTSRSSLLVIDDYYTPEEEQHGSWTGQGHGSQGQGHQSQGQRPIRRSRSRSMSSRPPMLRSRSLSMGRSQVGGLVPRVTPRLRVSRSRIDSVIPVAVPGPHRIEDESVAEDEEEEKEEWQYVPFSFWALPRRDKLILFSLGTIDLTLYMCLSILAPFFPNEVSQRVQFH